MGGDGLQAILRWGKTVFTLKDSAPLEGKGLGSTLSVAWKKDSKRVFLLFRSAMNKEHLRFLLAHNAKSGEILLIYKNRG